MKFVSGNESGTFETLRCPERKGIPSVLFVSGVGIPSVSFVSGELIPSVSFLSDVGIPSVSFVSGESTKLIAVIGQSSLNRLLGMQITLSKLF